MVEIMVSLALLSLVLIGFSLLFTHSNVVIFSTGEKNTALYQAQRYLENRIAVSDYAQDEITNKPKTLSIKFSAGTERTITISGEESRVDVNYLSGNKVQKTISLTTFLPE